MTERKDALRSDLAKADARGVTPEDLEIPEVTDEMFASAKPHIAARCPACGQNHIWSRVDAVLVERRSAAVQAPASP